MAKACPVCRSKRWRKDRMSGLVVCEEGHILQNYRTENNEMEDAPRTAMQKRHIRKGPRRRRRRAPGEVNPDHYRGNDKEYLRLQLFQLLLRHQIKAVIRIWKVPPIVEAVARDLWMGVLSLYPLPPPPMSTPPAVVDEDARIPLPGEPVNRIKITSERVWASQPLPDRHVPSSSQPVPADQKDGEEMKNDDHFDHSRSDESAVSETSDDVDSDLVEKISAESGSDTDHQEQQVDEEELLRIQRRKHHVQAKTALVVLVLSLWTLRVPILYLDIIQAIDNGDIPYIDFGSSSLIPDEVKKHLPLDMRNRATWPLNSPSPTELHAEVKRMVNLLDGRLGIQIPEMNAAPVLWRLTSCLGGTPVTYNSAYKILQLTETSIDLSPPRDAEGIDVDIGSDADEALEGLSLGSNFHFKTKRRRLQGLAGPPELGLLSAILITFKLIYGLDGQTRLPAGPHDLLIGQANGSEWLAELKKLLSENRLCSAPLSATPLDFAKAGDAQVDEFIARAENALLIDRPTPTDAAWLQELFPLTGTIRSLDRSPSDDISKVWQDFHASTTYVKMPPSHAPELHLERHAEEYKVYDAKDLTGQLPDAMETLLVAASRLIGVSREQILRSLEATERRLMRAQRIIRSHAARQQQQEG